MYVIEDDGGITKYRIFGTQESMLPQTIDCVPPAILLKTYFVY